MKKGVFFSALALVLCCIAMQGCIMAAPSNAVNVAPSEGYWIFNMFVLGGIGFWIYVLILVITLALALNCYEDEWIAVLIVLTIGLIGMWVFGAFNPLVLMFGWVATHPQELLVSIVSYVVLGFGWACFKLKLKSIDTKNNYLLEKREFLKRKNVTGSDVPLHLKEEWRTYCQSYRLLNVELRRYKSKIIFWMAWWPISLIEAMIADFIVRLFDNIYKYCEGYFDAILRSSFKKYIDSDLLVEEDKSK